VDTTPADRLRDTARDLLRMSVGFGVLGFQRAQVRRRELEKSLGATLPTSPGDLARLVDRLVGDR
jgi:hypothetical protein